MNENKKIKRKLKNKEKSLRRKTRRDEKNYQAEVNKARLKSFLGIGGEYSMLEIAILSAPRLGLIVRGDLKPETNVALLCKELDRQEGIGESKPLKLKCSTQKDFYSSRAWKILRYQAFEIYGNKCSCCGASSADDITLHVDHIKPRSTNPELSLDMNNLQILCEPCNIGKINQWDTDWRWLNN